MNLAQQLSQISEKMAGTTALVIFIACLVAILVPLILFRGLSTTLLRFLRDGDIRWKSNTKLWIMSFASGLFLLIMLKSVTWVTIALTLLGMTGLTTEFFLLLTPRLSKYITNEPLGPIHLSSTKEIITP